MASTRVVEAIGDDATPGERVMRLKERALRPGTDAMVDRAFAFDRGFAATRGCDVVWRKACALAEMIGSHRVEIHDDELIVGRRWPDERHGSSSGSWLGYPEWWNLHSADAQERFRGRVAEDPRLSDGERARLGEMAERWGETFGRDSRNVPTPDFARHGHVFFGWGYSLNHSVRDFARVIDEGFEGIRREIEAQLEGLAWKRPEDIRRRLFLESALTIADAACALGPRYAGHARELAEHAGCPERRAELLAIADVCDQVPARPARSLHEALQALWFAHTITFWEDGLNANSIGRIDQMLWPCYERDRRENGLTREQAVELFHCFHLKLYQTYDVQQAVVGGRRIDIPARSLTTPAGYDIGGALPEDRAALGADFPTGKRVYRAVFLDREGKQTHSMIDAARKIVDNRLDTAAVRTEQYAWRIPEDVEGPVRLVARLNYVAYPLSFAKGLELPPASPTLVSQAQHTVTVAASR